MLPAAPRDTAARLFNFLVDGNPPPSAMRFQFDVTTPLIERDAFGGLRIPIYAHPYWLQLRARPQDTVDHNINHVIVAASS